jgi:hypothetical protein
MGQQTSYKTLIRVHEMHCDYNVHGTPGVATHPCAELSVSACIEMV